MKKDGILILGAGIMQLPAYEAAAKNGWYAIAADGNPNAPCRNRADHFLNIDLKDRVGLAEAAEELRQTVELKGVFTCGTDFSASVAWVAEKLGLPGIPYQTALDCTDKYRMRSRFREAGVPCPDFCEYSPDLDLEKETRRLNYPLVVKPVDNMGGRGVITAADKSELEEAVVEAVRFSRTGRAIIEEYMDGEEFSIDSIVYDGEIYITGFADRHIYYPPCFIEMGHTLPSAVDSETRDNIFETFKMAVRALGITLGSAKGDIKLDSRGVMIGEIAARLSGGYMSGWTYPYASGVMLVEKGMRLAMGMNPGSLEEIEHNSSSERAFLSIPGRIEGIRHLEEAHDLPLVRDLFLLSDTGDQVEFPRNNVMKCGNVIAVGEDRESAVAASAAAVSLIRIDLEADNDETLAFLSSPLNSVFPPSAYDISHWESKEELLNFQPDFSMQYNESSVPVPPASFLKQQDWNLLSLERALEECVDSLPSLKGEGGEKSEWTLFARHFWYALIRGGIQGALWYIKHNNEDL